MAISMGHTFVDPCSIYRLKFGFWQRLHFACTMAMSNSYDIAKKYPVGTRVRLKRFAEVMQGGLSFSREENTPGK